jgi:hypothetical protein
MREGRTKERNKDDLKNKQTSESQTLHRTRTSRLQPSLSSYPQLISSTTPCPIVSKDKTSGSGLQDRGCQRVGTSQGYKTVACLTFPLIPAPLFSEGCSFQLQILERTAQDKEMSPTPTQILLHKQELWLSKEPKEDLTFMLFCNFDCRTTVHTKQISNGHRWMPHNGSFIFCTYPQI